MTITLEELLKIEYQLRKDQKLLNTKKELVILKLIQSLVKTILEH